MARLRYALLACSMQKVCTDQDVHCAALCSTIPCRDKLLAGDHPDVTTRHDLKFQLVLFVKHSQNRFTLLCPQTHPIWTVHDFGSEQMCSIATQHL